MTSFEVQAALWNLYKHHQFRIMNVYFFQEESDFLSFTKTGYCQEVEVKVSRSDFFADFKKEKHLRFTSDGDIRINIGTEKYPYHVTRKKENTANRFYFAVPEGLVDVNELPDYAGLIYIEELPHSGRHFAEVIKKAPLLHKKKHDTSRLMEKYYWNYVNRMIENIGQHYQKKV